MSSDLGQLVREASCGHAPAVDELLARFLPGLRAFVRVRCGPRVRAHESSSDVVQSICREVLAEAERFQFGGEAGFKHWLYTTALRKLQRRDEHWRAQKRDVGRNVAAEDEEVFGCYRAFSSPSERAIAREQAERIERAFDELNEADREVITLSRMVGLSHQEIASQLGRTEQATRLLLHRALAKLSEKLETVG